MKEKAEERINGQSFEFVVNNYPSSFSFGATAVMMYLQRCSRRKYARWYSTLTPDLIFSHLFCLLLLASSVHFVSLFDARSQVESIKRDFMKIICALASIIRSPLSADPFFATYTISTSLFCRGMTLHTKARPRLPFLR